MDRSNAYKLIVMMVRDARSIFYGMSLDSMNESNSYIYENKFKTIYLMI